MGTVSINSNNFTIYGTSAAADIHWDGSIGDTATLWAASDDDTRAKGLVSATRLLDRQRYVDAAATFSLRDAITAFQTACYELAGMIIENPSLVTDATSGQNIKRVDAGGGVGVEFFSPTLGITGRFPTNIQELIGEYLAGAEGGEISGSYVSGTGESSTFGDTNPNDLYGLTRGI